MWDLRPTKGSDPGSIPVMVVGSWEGYLTFSSLSFLSFKMGMKTPNHVLITVGGTQQMASLAPSYWSVANTSTDTAPAAAEPRYSCCGGDTLAFASGTHTSVGECGPSKEQHAQDMRQIPSE